MCFAPLVRTLMARRMREGRLGPCDLGASKPTRPGWASAQRGSCWAGRFGGDHGVPLLVVGVSHRTAPMGLLDRLAVPDPGQLAGDAAAGEHVSESMAISTCNRVEIYAEVDRFHAAVDDLAEMLAKSSGVPLDDFLGHCYVHYDERAVHHLFELAVGLDSMVVGEQQILGQVRAALGAAQDLGTAGRELNEVGQAALRIGKRVRAATAIDRAGASIVSVGMAEAFDRLADLGGPDISNCSVVVIGAGAMSSLVVANLGRAGIGHLTVANRNADGARRVAHTARVGRGVGMGGLTDLVRDADLVVCCTGASGVVLGIDPVRQAMADRSDRPLVVLDLALPHDTDPEIADLSGVTRIDLADTALEARGRADGDETVAARTMLAEELRVFLADRASRDVEPIVRSLRARASAVVELELHRVAERLPELSPEQSSEIARGMRRVVNTLLHTPTVRVKELASDPDGRRYAQALNSLFDLSVDLVDAVVTPSDADSGDSYLDRDPGQP